MSAWLQRQAAETKGRDNVSVVEKGREIVSKVATVFGLSVLVTVSLIFFGLREDANDDLAGWVTENASDLVAASVAEIDAYPASAAAEQIDDYRMVVPAVIVSLWRDGVRLGRGVDIESPAFVAVQRATRDALRNMVDVTGLEAHVSVVTDWTVDRLAEDDIGQYGFAITDESGELIANSIMTASQAIEEGRSLASVERRLARWMSPGLRLAKLSTIQIAANGNGLVQEWRFGAPRSAMGDEDLLKHKRLMVQWLRESQRRKPWGYTQDYAPLTGSSSKRPDLTLDLKLAWAATQLHVMKTLTYFHHERDLKGVLGHINKTDGRLCVSCGSKRETINSALALLILLDTPLTDSVYRDAASGLYQALLSQHSSKTQAEDGCRDYLDETNLEDAYLRLSIVKAANKLSTAEDVDAPFCSIAPSERDFAAVSRLLAGLEASALGHATESNFGSVARDDAGETTKQIPSQQSESTNASIDMRFARSDANADFRRLATLQYTFDASYFCSERYRCIGGFKTNLRDPIVSANLWYLAFLFSGGEGFDRTATTAPLD